jgi:hypothetical protein
MQQRQGETGPAVAEYRGEKLKTLISQAPFCSTDNYSSQFPITISQCQTRKKTIQYPFLLQQPPFFAGR